MPQFFGVVRHEFAMSIRRKGVWIAYSLVFLFFGISLFTPSQQGPTNVFSGDLVWQEAGGTVYLFNMLMPLVGGILAADRMQRDVHLGVRELQTSTPLSRLTYILGKYVGVLLSLLLPLLVGVIAIAAIAIASGQTSPVFIGAILVAFLSIAVPSFAFVVAFSLACPLVLPLRVYQILFTGYWFWGNFLNDQVFPTVSGTLLNSSGIYALQGFFQGTISRTQEALHTPLEAWLNILVLSLCAAIALFTLERYLAWQAQRA
jgi:ABC-2 type transport system permease protein